MRVSVDREPVGDYASMTLWGSKIFLFGGWTGFEYTNALDVFDLRHLDHQQEWQCLHHSEDRPDKPAPRHGHTMVEWENKLYL